LRDTDTVDRRPGSGRPLSARTQENVETVNDLVLSQEDKSQTHTTVREISRETGIRRSSVSRIICQDLHLKCFNRRRAQELTDANCAARMKHAKPLLQKFPQSATDFVFFLDEKVFSRSLHLTIGRTTASTHPVSDTRKCSNAAERLLRGRPTFSKSLILSRKIAIPSYA